MSTLVMSKEKNRSRQSKQRFIQSGWLMAAAVFCIIVDQIYALFGHGVRSAAMSLMFLYPLVASVFYFIREYKIPFGYRQPYRRLADNLLNSGIATLTAGSCLTGILEIAGSTSAYVPAFMIVGAAMTIAGLICHIPFGKGGRNRK